MHAIEIESPEVFEGIMHGFMHKGLTDEAHEHSAPDVIYVGVSDRAADFEVRGILRKSTIPYNFLACGYTSIVHKLRGRNVSSLTIILSPDVLHIDPDIFCGAMAEFINHPSASVDQWKSKATLVVYGSHSQAMLNSIQDRLYKNYLGRNPMFTKGSPDLVGNINLEDFFIISNEEADMIDPDTKTIRRQFFFDESFKDLDQEAFYRGLLKLHTRVAAGENLVFHPEALRHLYDNHLSPLELYKVKL